MSHLIGAARSGAANQCQCRMSVHSALPTPSVVSIMKHTLQPPVSSQMQNPKHSRASRTQFPTRFASTENTSTEAGPFTNFHRFAQSSTLPGQAEFLSSRAPVPSARQAHCHVSVAEVVPRLPGSVLLLFRASSRDSSSVHNSALGTSDGRCAAHGGA